MSCKTPAISLLAILLCSSTVSAQRPSFEWAIRTGAAGTLTIGHSIDVDAAANVYTAGRFTGTVDFDPGAGSVNLVSAGSVDAFITKTDPSGNLIWAKRVGGTQDELIYAITVDGSGNVYLTGSFQGTADFDPGPGVSNLTASPGFTDDVFILKLDLDGNFLWAKRIGSSGFDFGHSIAVGSSGIFTTGSFEGTVDFDPGPGTTTLVAPAGQGEIFILKLDENGNFVWAKRMGGSNGDSGKSITIDGAGNIYTTGFFRGTADFDPGAGTHDLTATGSTDIFVSKLDASGNFIWAKGMGGSGFDEGAGIKVDIVGNVYTTGSFVGTADFDPGTGTSNLVAVGSNDSFVSKLDASGNFIWAKRIGGAVDDESTSLSVDGAGNVYAAGSFESTVDFDPGPGLFNITSLGAGDAFITKLDPSGSFVWAAAFGGPLGQLVNGIKVNAAGGVYTTGSFSNTVDFDPGTGISNLTAAGTFDLFVSKLNQPPTIASFTPTSGTTGTIVTITGDYFSATASNNIVYLGGVRANVSAATNNQLTITVPAGAAHDRISVTVNGLTGLSQNPFIVNFGSGQNINASSFAPKVDLATDLEPYAVGQADFDQDGKLDLVSANYSGSTLSVFQNNSSGPGNIAFAAKVDFTVGLGRPYAITTGDFDGDSKQDFAVANEFTNTVAVFRNTSSGPGNIGFAPRVDFPTGAFPHGITAADFNNDGKIDLAVTSNNLDVVSVYSNLSSGSGNINFAPRIDFAAGGASQDVTHADLDSDGRPDLIVTNYSAQSISVLRNTSTSGAITFAPKADLTAGTLPNFVSTGDVDGDGKLDLTVANASSETISVYRNTSTPGSITLAPKVDFPATGGFAVGLADLNGDGKIDLAVPDFANSVTVIQNSSTGPGTIAFGLQQGFATGNIPQSVSVGDYDGDGKPDLAVANQSSHTLSILRNTVLIPPPTITGFTPPFGPVGTSVTVTGTNFSPLAGNNIVYFGATKAVVSAATSTQLTVTAPAGSTYNPLSVTVSGKTAYAPAPFVATYTSTGVINATTFAAKVDFSTATEPTEAIIGDLDGDGKPDVASINNSTPSITTFRNTSTPGTVSFATAVDFPAGTNAQAMEVGDIDADGKLDLVTVDWTPQVSVFRNTGSPGTINFATNVNFTTGTSPVKVAIGDLDGDGLTDLVVANGGTNSVSAFRNTGSPGTISFAPRINLTTGANPYDVSVSDMDGDGLKDIIVPSRSAHVVSIFRNTSTPGTLSFAAAVDLALGIGNQPFSIATGDLNDDNKADIAVLYRTTKLLAVIRNNSSPGNLTTATFDSPVTYSTSPSDPAYVAFGDVSGDGKPDVLVGNDNGTTVQVLKNLTSPGPFSIVSFAASVSYTTGSRPNTVKSGDIDGDQLPDLIVANSVSNTVSVLRNQSGSCVPAAQRNALIALYNATDGVNWTDNTGWLSPDESTWYGVTLTGCNVTDISLPGNNLVGSLPPEIGDLIMLEGLDLGINQLSGSIPPEIGNLTSLIGLNLSVNQLDGFLPPELGNLTSLEALNLSFNRLGGTPPIELENLLALVDAALNNNQFIGQPPLIGGNSIAMSTVQLQFNEFTALPDFTAYYSINLINVSNNRLTFDDLEPFMAISNFFYDPQALVPPGGIISFIPGGTLSIPFATGGTGNSYQWYKDNVLIPGATFASLSLPGVTAADVGFYHVRITSSVVPILVLQSMVYTVITDPCAASTPTSGDIDPTFAPLIDVPSFFSQVEVQSTGRIIAESNATVINSVSHQGLLRFLPDGTLDNSFAANLYMSPFLVQANDHILATSNSGTYAYVVRLDAQGNEDAAFTANVPQYYSGNIYAIALQPDNKILVAGSAYLVPTFIERLNPDGTSDGLLPDASGLDVSVIRVQSDGFILVGGQFPGGIVRLDPTGTLDPSFIAHTDGFVSDIAIQSDGKILVSGMFALVNGIPKRGIVRLHPDGSIDNSFTALGITNLIESGLNARQIALQTDGKIVLAGEFSSINGADRINVVRLNTDGTVDCGFDPGTGTDLPITGLALPSDNQILISGNFIDYNGTPRLGLARINSGSTSSCLPATERAALIALYNSTNGVSWTNNTNWLSADESTWHGVIVSSCHVTNINLDNNLLAGPLPPELGDLNQLLTLQLSNNAITGSIPASLPNLGSLISLQLYNNQLTGSIPAGLYGMTTLQNLDLSNNQLTGSVSTSIGNLIGLTSLSLSINQFTGTLPSEIGNLTNLQYLRLALNQFSGSLPGTFGNLLQLREFTVATNLLTGTVPASLANLTNLNVLGLSFNGFTGDLPSGIGSLTALQQVSVRSNQFTSLPAFTSTSITELRTENNRFHFGHLEPNATKGGFTYTPQANLAGGTANTCEGTTLTIPFTTPGTANQYQWYKDGVLLPGATSSSFTKSSATPGDAGNYVVQVTNTLLPGLTLVSDPFVVSINGAPPAPTVTGATSCTAGTLTLSASGGSPGEYRWYATATGGTDLGTGSGTFITPVISVTTILHVAINNGTCEGARTPVTATIDAVSKPTITTSNCTASGVTLAGPTGFASYTWSNGATTSQITITTGGTYTLVVTSAGGCVSPASDGVTFTNSFCNQPPALQPTPVATTVQSTVTVNISAMASDLDNNIDLSSLQVISQPTSGATAFINANFELVIDYSGVSFVGTDQLTIELCDVAGACVQEVITIEVAGEITVFNALSPNGDGKNDVFFIQYINALPETQQNKVTVLNRWGTVVFEVNNYDNINNAFRGLSNGGDELPSGTYYYILEFSSGAAKRTGFISLRR